MSQGRGGPVIHCFVCGGSELRKLYSLPLVDGPYAHAHEAQNRTIYRCGVCGHLSTDFSDSEKYAQYYSSLSEDYHCDHDRDHSRYEQICSLLPKQSKLRVLDIGCGSGTFLRMLPSHAERFGIEPSRAAARVAQEQGIQILGHDDLDRAGLRHGFDVVTAIDVVEHTPDLQHFRRMLATALRPGGTAIILTGDCESLSARLLGPHWYYFNFAEHVSVFSPHSMRNWLDPDFVDIEVVNSGHHRLNTRENLRLMRAWLLFPIKRILWKLLPKYFNFAHVSLYSPGGHMLVRAIRKSEIPSHVD